MEINTQSMNIKSWVWQSIAILLGLFLLMTVLDKAYSVWQDFRPTVPKNTIMMSAEGKVSATPDLAVVTIGVVSNGASAKVVQEDMTKKVNTVIDLVKKLGVDAKDITTSNFNVYPNYNYSEGKQGEITSYQGNETVTIKVHGVDQSAEKVNKILAGAVENGSNQIQGVYFDFNDADNFRQEARKLAIEKAKQKAQELANQTGLRLGRIVSFSDNGGYYPQPYFSEGKGGGGPVSMAAPDVQPGSQDITASITVTFEVK